MTTRNATRIAALLVVAAFLAACGSGLIILESILTAAEAALPIVSNASGLSQATQAELMNYLQLVSTDVSKVSVILQSGETGAKEAADIAAVFASTIPPALGPAVPLAVRTVIQAVAAAVQAFTSQFTTPKAGIRALSAATASATALDKGALARTKKHAEELSARIAERRVVQ